MRWDNEYSDSEENISKNPGTNKKLVEIWLSSPTSTLSATEIANPNLTGSPVFCLQNSTEPTEVGSSNSDFELKVFDSALEDEFSHVNLLQRFNSISKYEMACSKESLLLKSQQPKAEKVLISPQAKRDRTLSGPVSELTHTPRKCRKPRRKKAKVMKYIRDLTTCFEDFKVINEDVCSNGEKVAFYKAQHTLDGQTYILKKRWLYIENHQDIHDHPSYQEILDVKDNSTPLNLRYITSWVELDRDAKPVVTGKKRRGLHVILCIQMRFVDSLKKLAQDLIVLSGNYPNSDEDTIHDMAEEAYEEVQTLTKKETTLKEAVIQAFSKIGLDDSAQTGTLKHQVWRICLEETIAQAAE